MTYGVEILSPNQLVRAQTAPDPDCLLDHSKLTRHVAYRFPEYNSSDKSQKSISAPIEIIRRANNVEVMQEEQLKQKLPFYRIWFKFKGIPFPINGSVLQRFARNTFDDTLGSLEYHPVDLRTDSSSGRISGITVGSKSYRYGVEFSVQRPGNVTVKLVQQGTYQYPISWVDEVRARPRFLPKEEVSEAERGGRISCCFNIDKIKNTFHRSCGPFFPSHENDRFFGRKIYVDGTPIETLTATSLEKLAAQVKTKELVVVVFQGCLGTELLFQTPQMQAPNLTEVSPYECDFCGQSVHPVFFEIKTSAYDGHSFIQGSFIYKGLLNLAEKILVGGWPEEDLEHETPEALLGWIQRKLSSKEGRMSIEFGDESPFLALQPRSRKSYWVSSNCDPSSPARTFPLAEVALPSSLAHS